MTLDMKSFRANSPLFLAKLSRIFFFLPDQRHLYFIPRIFLPPIFLLSSFPFLILFLFFSRISSFAIINEAKYYWCNVRKEILLLLQFQFNDSTNNCYHYFIRPRENLTRRSNGNITKYKRYKNNDRLSFNFIFIQQIRYKKLISLIAFQSSGLSFQVYARRIIFQFQSIICKI